MRRRRRTHQGSVESKEGGRRVIDFLSPTLLWGALAVASPILIHLLMRQKPRPTPWAAMRWLQAAVEVASRKYRLTNLLLLLLRCLLLLLLALALAQPSFSGVGRGGHLLLIIDTSASMGPRSDGPGALAEATAQLQAADLQHRRMSIVSVGEEVQVDAELSPAQAEELLGRLQAAPLPGGVDRAMADDESANRLLALTSKDTDVIIVSDFGQDDGSGLLGLLTAKSRSTKRWRLPSANNNALVTGIAGIGDLVPGMPSELLLRLTGQVSRATLSIDDGPAAERRLQVAGELARLPLPPLEAGWHRLQITLLDAGLTYDDVLELPVRVRQRVPVVILEQQRTPLSAALLADSHRLETTEVQSTSLANLPLPPDGIVALRRPVVGGGARLRDWLQDGGVLWATWPVLLSLSEVRGLLPELQVAAGDGPGGPLRSTQEALNANLARVEATAIPRLQWPEDSRFLLYAGEDPLVGAIPVGRGLLLVEVEDISRLPGVDALAAWPLWVRQTARDAAASRSQPTVLEAGRPAPRALRLERLGRQVEIAAGEPLLLPPGLWQTPTGSTPVESFVIVPSRHEGSVQSAAPRDLTDSLSAVLPRQLGANWGPFLLAVLLAMALVEGAVAAWAGRRYGH